MKYIVGCIVLATLGDAVAFDFTRGAGVRLSTARADRGGTFVRDYAEDLLRWQRQREVSHGWK